MTLFSQNFQKIRKVSSQILDKVVCIKFHQNRPKGAATKGCDRQTDAQTGLIPGVNILSNKMTEYNKVFEVLKSKKYMIKYLC